MSDATPDLKKPLLDWSKRRSDPADLPAWADGIGERLNCRFIPRWDPEYRILTERARLRACPEVPPEQDETAPAPPMPGI